MKKNILVVIASVLFSVILWISISLSSEYYYTINIPVKLVNFPEGYSSGTKLPDKITIKIKGKGWNILPFNVKTSLRYNVSAGNEPGFKTVIVQNSVSENSWINSDIQIISIKPDTLSFFIEKISEKKVKIIPEINMSFKGNYGLASPITVNPESTIVYGPRSYMKNLTEISTKKMFYSQLEQKVIERIPLEEKDGFFFHDENVVLKLDVQQIVEKNFENVLVEVRNVPKSESVMLIPNYISIGLRGGIDALGKIKPENLKPYVKYEDIKRDDPELLVPKVDLGLNIKVLFIKPNELKYIIKKF